MTITQWLIFILVIQIIHGLGTWKLYVKAGRQAWEAFVPVYNAVVLMKIINRPWWWTILLFVPIVNLIMLPVVWVETARSFGKNQFLDTFLAVATLGFYNYYLNYATDVTYVNDRDINPKSSSGDWTSSVLFAIVAATIVHTYFIQPFTIPSSSLEKSLLVGDFLFVSKFHYGARIPMTTVATPMVHDTIPGLNVKSYLFDDNFEARKTSWKNKLQLPYMRIPGFEDIERNDIVVFNQPADTLVDMNKFTPDRNYYKPIDKKTNLVKRCVGVPGDSLEVRDGYVYINGKLNELPDRAKLQFVYLVGLKGNYSGDQLVNSLKSRYDITDVYPSANNSIVFHATEDAANKAKNHPNIASVERIITPKNTDGKLFPRAPQFPWNYDNFGPIYIPKKGETVELTMEVLPLYKRLIGEYERNSIVTRGNQIIINDKPATSYTFKQDYYWMMGDNRNNSIDARAWGYVPFDHVVGKPVFIWMSWDGLKNPRWERWFTTVGGSGNPVSYLIPFLVLLGIWFGFNAWRKRKNA
nr:signal peptidase I [uncultured Psychroserpens sp.]